MKKAAILLVFFVASCDRPSAAPSQESEREPKAKWSLTAVPGATILQKDSMTSWAWRFNSQAGALEMCRYDEAPGNAPYIICVPEKSQ